MSHAKKTEGMAELFVGGVIRDHTQRLSEFVRYTSYKATEELLYVRIENAIFSHHFNYMDNHLTSCCACRIINAQFNHPVS